MSVPNFSTSLIAVRHKHTLVAVKCLLINSLVVSVELCLKLRDRLESNQDSFNSQLDMLCLIEYMPLNRSLLYSDILPELS